MRCNQQTVRMRKMPETSGKQGAMEYSAEQETAKSALPLPSGRFEHIFAASPAVIYVLGFSGRTATPLWVSGNIVRIWGYPADEAMASGWWFEHLHPDDRPGMAGVIDTLLEQDELTHEYRFRHSDGTYRWVRDELRLVRGPDGTPLEAVGSWTIIDDVKRAEDTLRAMLNELEQHVAARTAELSITMTLLERQIEERQRFESGLMESEERYRKLVELSPDGVYLFSEGRVVFANGAAAKLIGAPAPEQLIGKTIDDLVHRDYREASRQRIKRVLEQRQDYSAVEIELVQHGGGSVRVEVASSHVTEAGKPAALIMARDIRPRRQAEESVRRFRAALDSSADAIFLIDRANMCFFDVNETACTSLGYTRDELLAMGPQDIKPFFSEAALRARFDEALQSAAHRTVIETHHKRRDDSLFPVEVHVRSLESDGKPIVVAIARDIGERKQAEQERLARALAQRDTLVREVHHRIKNHLQGVVGLLERHIAKHPEAREAMENAIGQVYSIALVHGLQSDALNSELTLCEMVAGIARAARDLTRLPIEPAVEVTIPRPVRVHVDEAVPIALIVNELLYNALKHGAQNVQSEPVRVHLSGDANRAVIRVSNDCAAPGPSFDLASGRGTGTGLNLVKSLLPVQGAELRFDFDGTTLTAELALFPPVIARERT
jgi:PAS domain S-box-containing protein